MDWDARTYDRIADPMTRWGTDVVERLPLRGDERVLDAGCGSGRVTEQLLTRYPGIRVVALDRSPAMLIECAARLVEHAHRLELVEADLALPLPIDEPVDAVVSTATFHWVSDQDALFHNLAAVMRPGAPLVAQCGGPGNIGNVRAALHELGESRTPWTFATPEEATARLEAAGFADVETSVFGESVALEPGEPLRTYLATVILRGDLAEHVNEVAARLTDGVIDYVRLNLSAKLR